MDKVPSVHPDLSDQTNFRLNRINPANKLCNNYLFYCHCNIIFLINSDVPKYNVFQRHQKNNYIAQINNVILT